MDDDDKWYKAKLQFITIDEKSEKEKRSNVTYLCLLYTSSQWSTMLFWISALKLGISTFLLFNDLLFYIFLVLKSVC